MTKTVKYILLTQNIFINNKTRRLQRLVSNIRPERVMLTFALTLSVLIILDYNSGPTILPHSLLLSTSCIVVGTDKSILLDLQFGRLQSLFQLQQNSPKTDASQIMFPKIFYITSSPILRAPPFSVHHFVKSGTAFQQSFLECF